MRKKRQKKAEVTIDISNDNHTIKDCVVFMTAYHFDTVKKRLLHRTQKYDFCKLLTDCHITSISTGNFLQTKKGNCRYTTLFDPQAQISKFQFDTSAKHEDFSDEIRKSSWQFNLLHSCELLLNKTKFTLSCFLTLDKFWVSIKSRWFQVNPIAFFLNNDLFIEFELIDHHTNEPLKKDEIYGKAHNFNIIPVDKVQYFDEDIQAVDAQSIPTLILDNILRCLQCVTRKKYYVDSLSYIHNLLVISNSISNISSYFSDVMCAYGLPTVFSNINTNRCYEYYSQESLGVVTGVSCDTYQQALFDCQLLEAVKMYFLLFQRVNLDIASNLTDTVNNQLYLEYLLFTSDLPIITLNALHNMEETPIFRRHKKAIEFKVSYLQLKQEERKNQNGIVLNILIYILTFISGIGAWQVIQVELGVPFKFSAVIMTTIFVFFAIIWIVNEKRK